MSTPTLRPVTGRFAPSPTGRMHLGNVFSALLSWLSARSQGGRWLLRIEDLDPDRSRPEHAQWLLDDLQWLGLTWDGSPVYQSRRHDIYQAHFMRLQAQGFTYPCYCTRADLLATQAPHERDGRVVYAGTCRHLPPQPGRPAAVRLLVPDEDVSFTDGHYGPQRVNLAREVGDFIIRRKDGAWAYQLAVVVDDALMGVSEVVRGRDLLLSTPQQIHVARLLGYGAPRYVHLPLLCRPASATAAGGCAERLSKRDRSLDMGCLRQRYTAPRLLGLLAALAGLIPSPAEMSLSELTTIFSWAKVPRADIAVPASLAAPTVPAT